MPRRNLSDKRWKQGRSVNRAALAHKGLHESGGGGSVAGASIQREKGVEIREGHSGDGRFPWDFGDAGEELGAAFRLPCDVEPSDGRAVDDDGE